MALTGAQRAKRKRDRKAGRPVAELGKPTTAPSPPPATTNPATAAPPSSHVDAPAVPPLPDLDETDPKAVLGALVGPLRAIIHRLASSPTVDTAAVGRLVTSLTSVSKMVARLDGDFDLTESMLLRSKVFAPVREAILDALEPFPGALEAVRAAMARLSGS